MDATLEFELEDREKPSRYVLDSQKWYLPNINNKCSNTGGGGGEVHKGKVNVSVTC